MPDFIQALVDNTELLSAGGLPGITPVANPGIPSPSVAVSVPGLSAAQTSSAVTLSESALATGELDPEPLLEPKSQPIGGLLESKTTEISEKATDPIVGDSTEIFTKTTEDSTANTGDHAGSLAGPVAGTDPLTGERSNPTNPESKSLLAKTTISTTQSSAGGQDVTGDPLLAPTQASATQTQTTTATETVKDSSLAIPDNFTSGVFTVGKDGEVGVDFLFDGGAYKGELAIFSLAGMEDLSVNSVDFIREATKRALSGSKLGHVVIADRTEGAKFGGATGSGAIDSFNTGDYLGLKTFQMTAGDKFAVMMSPDGSFEKLRNNPNAGGSWRPLFSLAPANPNAVIQTARIADITGDGQAFAMEDLRLDGKSDKDFNDLVFQFRGATGRVSGGVDPTRLPSEVRGYVTDPKFTILTTDPFPGRPVDVEFRVSNPQDGTTGAAQMNFYLSTDSVFGDQNDIFLGRYTSEPLAPGASTGLIQGSVLMPPNFYPFWNQIGDGQYYIGTVPANTSAFTTEAVLGRTFESLNFDLAGETPNSARLSYPASLQGRTYRGQIGGADPADYYEFRLGMGGRFDVALAGLTENVDVALLDSQGRLLATGLATPDEPLAFSQWNVIDNEFGVAEVVGGETYNLRLLSSAPQATNYQLTLQATPKIPGLLLNAADSLIYSNAVSFTAHGQGAYDDPDTLDVDEAIPWLGIPAMTRNYNRSAFDFIRLNEARQAYREFFDVYAQGSNLAEVAVLDSGFAGNSRIDILPTSRVTNDGTFIGIDNQAIYDNPSPDNVPNPATAFGSHHAFNVAGIIGGSDPDMGVAPHSNLRSIQVLAPTYQLNAPGRAPGFDPDLSFLLWTRLPEIPSGTGAGTYPSLESGLHRVIDLVNDYRTSQGERGADIAVVNLSLGTDPTYIDNDEVSGVEEEIETLVSLGVIVVAGTGNGGQTRSVSNPANLKGVIGVGAVSHLGEAILDYDRYDENPDNDEADNSISFKISDTVSLVLPETSDPGVIAPFSNYRDANPLNVNTPDATIFAPGIAMVGAGLGISPNAQTLVDAINANLDPARQITELDLVTTMWGTSQATPVISGLAILAQEFAQRELGRRLTPAEFHHLLISTGTGVKGSIKYAMDGNGNYTTDVNGDRIPILNENGEPDLNPSTGKYANAKALFDAIASIKNSKTSRISSLLEAEQVPDDWDEAKFVYEFSRNSSTISVNSKAVFYKSGQPEEVVPIKSTELPEMSVIAVDAFWPSDRHNPAIVVEVNKQASHYDNQTVAISFGNNLNSDYELSQDLSLVRRYSIKGDQDGGDSGAADNPNVVLTMNDLHVNFGNETVSLPFISATGDESTRSVTVSPPNTNGDGEFDGNGPQVSIEVTLDIDPFSSPSSRIQVLAQTSFSEVNAAGNPYGDKTVYKSEWETIGHYQAPRDMIILPSMIMNETSQDIKTLDPKPEWGNPLDIDLGRYSFFGSDDTPYNEFNFRADGGIRLTLKPMTPQDLLDLLQA